MCVIKNIRSPTSLLQKMISNGRTETRFKSSINQHFDGEIKPTNAPCIANIDIKGGMPL